MSKLNSNGGLLLLLAMFFSGCTSESFLEIPKSTEPVALTESAQVRGIRNYLNHTHKGTRAGDYQLIPYVVECDTVMYIAQYEDGWELFSNSFTAPMSLMKNDTGIFDPMLAGANPVFRAIFNNMVSVLKENKASLDTDTLPGAGQWNSYKGIEKNSLPGDISESVYTLVGSKITSEEKTSIPHLIKTHWHQDPPYNYYMPLKESNSSKHISVGCTAVAFGQFFYYSHFKWGTPMEIPSKATYDSASNTYNFTDFNSSQWSKMPYVSYAIYEDTSVPMLLGWIAKMIKATPTSEDGETSTYAYLTDAVEFANGILSNDLTIEKYSQIKSLSMLKESKPIILELKLMGTDKSHTLIIDAVEATETTTEMYYAYVNPNSGSGSVDPDPNPTPGPNPGIGDDYNTLVSKYGQVFIERRYDTYAKFKFNWGWGNILKAYDETSIDGSVLSFASPDNPKDIFQYYRICTYNVK